jgi:hypothetical protein
MVRHLVVGWVVRVWINLRFEILSYKISMDNFVKQFAHKWKASFERYTLNPGFGQLISVAFQYVNVRWD